MAISRRAVLRTSAAFAAANLAPGVWSCEGSSPTPLPDKLQYKFRRYRPAETAYPVTVVTPQGWHFIHTFYDVCPLSPTQKYLAVTRLPFDDREPSRGDIADVCVIDLEAQTMEKVYSTQAWGMQLGANVQWGADDRHLYTNDVIDGEPVCVRIDLEERSRLAFAGPKYDIAPDESDVIGFPLDLINATQTGYGAPEDWLHKRRLSSDIAKDQGLWRTNLTTNSRHLVVSIWDLVQKLPSLAPFEDGTFYLFHSKYNKQKTRILQVVRFLYTNWFRDHFRKKRFDKMVMTFDQDGGDIHLAVDHQLWGRGGHHPNWHPDGERIVMNLNPKSDHLRFCSFKYDGSDFRILSENIIGSGHPSVEASGRYLLTDAYVYEPVARSNHEVPIRLIDLISESEEVICYIYTLGITGSLRLDPHPAWSRDYKKVIFNGAPQENRQVLIVDMS